MKFRKMVSLLALSALLGGAALAVEGCVEETPGPVYGYDAPYYPYGPATVGPPVVFGDWDEHRDWHDRDWWMTNRRPWAEAHHHEWLVPNNERHERD